MRNIISLGLIVFLIISLLIVKFPHSMLSPGEMIQGHQKLNNNCFACHDAFKSIENRKCISCHKIKKIDQKKHNNKFDTINQLNENFHASIKQYNCTFCHKDHKGHNIKLKGDFDHKLLKKESQENCTNCHRNRSDSLHKNISGSCSICHSTESWNKILKFNHKLVNSKIVNNCLSCHKVPKDDIHNNYKEDCLICHNTSKWSPAKFKHSHYFQLDHDHNVKCNICHNNKSFKLYSCYGCHEHSPGKIAEEHREEGINKFNNCVECHKDANEDSAYRYPKYNSNSKTYISAKKKENDDDD